MCALGYFEQFGVCVPCPSASGASAGAVFGLSLLLLVVVVGVYAIRQLLPVDVLKLGLSMVQVRLRWNCCACVGGRGTDGMRH